MKMHFGPVDLGEAWAARACSVGAECGQRTGVARPARPTAGRHIGVVRVRSAMAEGCARRCNTSDGRHCRRGVAGGQRDATACICGG